jgi:hypothetical protein
LERVARLSALYDVLTLFVAKCGKTFTLMRFRIDVNTLDGKLSYERDTPSDALLVAAGAADSLGVTITDTRDGRTCSPDEFAKRFGH